MANSVATVASLEGQAWAKAPDGKLRPLKVGDTVSAEEVVITATGAHIELDFGDGHPVSIAGGQEVLMNRDLWTDLASDNKDAAVDNASVQEALTVLNNGGDLTTALDETAAGLDGGGSNEGHSFVELARVIEQTEPNSFNFGINNPGTSSTSFSETGQVNNAPLVNAQGFTGDEDTIIAGRVIATDVENDSLTYSLTGQAANGVILLDPATGDFTYTPNTNYNGPDSFVVTVTDDHGNSTTSTVSLTVTSVNDAPITNDQNLTTLEDTPVSGQVVASDVEGDTLSYSISTTAAHGTVTLNPTTGGFVYTPSADYNGSDTFVVSIADGNGGVTTSTITIGITPVNDAPVSNNQNLTTLEDTPISGSVVATDVDGDALAYSVTSAATHGTVTLNAATGAFVYTPSANYNGADSFVVTIADGQGGVTTSIINIGVTPVNDAPDTNNQNLTTPEDTAISGQVVASDVEGDTLSYSIATTAAHGTVTLNPVTGGFVYTPVANYNGADQFVVSVADGNGGVSTSIINIGVTPVNDAPVTADQNLSTPEDTAVSGQVVATDVDGDILSYSVTSSAAHGSVALDSTTGSFTYTPANNYNGSDSFVVTVNDGKGGLTTSVINIGVTPLNDAPTSANQNLSTPQDTPINGSISANDPDGDTLTYNITGPTSHGSLTLNSATGSFVYTPSSGYNGSDSFTVSISDGHGGFTSSTVIIGVQPLVPVVNTAPTAADDSASTLQDTAVTIAVRGNDTDPDSDTLTVSGITQGAHGSVVIDAITGNPIYTPNSGYTGTDSFTYTINDGHSHTSTATVNVTVGAIAPVNSAPTAVGDSSTTTQDTAVTIAVRANDTDPDADTLTVSGVTQGANGSVVIDAITGNPIYTPNSGYTGTDSFTYTISDGHSHTSTATVTVNVTSTPVNLAPNAVNDTVSTNEETAVTVAVRGNDTDPNASDVLTVSAVTQGAHGSVVIDGVTGNPIYTPNTNFSGADSFTYTITDSGGLTSTATVNVTVNPVNDAPVNTTPAAQTLTQDGSLVFSSGNGNAISVGDVDAGTSAIQVTLTATHGLIDLSGTSGLSFVIGSGSGDITMTFSGTQADINNALNGLIYTPTGGYNGAAALQITTNDLGNTGSGGSKTDSDTISLTVNPAGNHAPVGVEDNIIVAEGGTATILVGGATSVLSNDSDADANALSAILVSNPSNGTLTLNANGTFSYTHNGGETTSDSFTYKVNDGSVDGNVVTVTIAVTAVDDASLLVADTKTVLEDNIATGNVLTNDSDVDSTLTVASFQVSGVAGTFTAGQTVLLAGIGSITLGGNGDYTFTPNSGWNGSVPQVTYTTNTGFSSTLNITVTDTNAAPDTSAVTATGNEDSTIAVTLSGSDSDGSVAGYVINSLPANGVLYSDIGLTHAITAGDLVSGTVYFNPATNWNGSTSFSYSAQDDLGAVDASPATASITVNPVVDTTTVSLSASGSVAEGGSITYTATLTDPAQSAVTVNLSNGSTITIASGATSGSVSVAAPTDDVYVDAGSVSLSISTATGGGFENLAIDPTAAITTITDTSDTTTLSLTGVSSINEGSSGVYTLSLTHLAQTDVTVTLNYAGVAANAADITGSVTVTIPANSGSADFSIAALTDGLVEGGESFTVSIVSATGGNFENLAISGVANNVTTSVVDTNSAVLSLSATPSLTEAGGALVYTANITSAPVSDLTVTLSNGETITILAGQTSGSKSITVAGSDDVYTDPTAISATITSTSGGGIGVNINPAPAVTNITDTIDTTTVSLGASGSAAEGGSIVYTATLTNPAQGAVTINLSNGSVITIADGATTGTVSVAAPTDDVYIDAGSVSVTIATATGGNFESLAIDPAPAVTAITDTNDTTTLSLTGAASITEGSSGLYTLSLTHPAQTDVTVTLNYSGVAASGTDITGSTTLTIPANSGSADFSITALTDGLVEGVESFTVSIASATGGNFENLVISGVANSVNTSLVDTNFATVSLTATPSLTEAGGTLVYTASINSAPLSDLTVTLSNGETITILAGQTSGSKSVVIAGSDDVYIDPSNISATITGTSGGGITVAINPAAAVTAITDTIQTTTVSLSATGSVTEGDSIVYTATLTNPAQGAVTVNLSNGSVITIANGATTGTVSVLAPTDDVYLDAGSVSVTIATASGGNFEALAIDPAPAVTTVADSVDTTSVSLTATGAVAEGGSILYTATLTHPAQGTVTVNLSNGAVISIANGALVGTVSVAAPTEDAYIDAGSVSTTITTAAGGNFEALTIDPTPAVTTVSDTLDTTTLSLSASGFVAEGGSIVYTATLTNPAHGPVTVNLSNGSVITIANGALTGTVSVAAPTDDMYLDASSVSATITTAAGGNFEALAISPVAAVTNITDTPDVTTVSLSATGSVAEGDSIVYTATLTNPAQGAVTLNLSNGAVITIADGATTGTVSVAAPTDDAYLDASSVSVTIATATGGNFETLAINPAAAVTTVTDTLDVTTVSLSASGSVAEGGSIVYTATLTNAAHGPVTVNLSNGSVITIANGATTGTVSVAAPTDDVYTDASTVSATIVGASGGNFETLAINAAPANTIITDTIDAVTLSLTGAASFAEGSSGTYTLSLTQPAHADVNVTLTYSGLASNGTDISGTTTVTILAGMSTANFDISALTDGAVEGTESFTVAIASATGGNFENLAISGAANSVVTNVVDADIATVSLSATPSLTEAGGTLVYTASISSAPVSNLVVTLSTGQTITILAGQTTGTKSIVVVGSDDVYVDPSNISATITGVSGGGINVAINPTAAVTAITDTLDTTAVTLSAAGAVVEGGSIVYTATVGSAVTDTPLVIHLSNGADITIPVGSTSATSAAVLVRADDAYSQGNQSVTVGISSTSGGNYEALNTTSTVTTVVSDDADTTSVTLSAAANVTEGGSIVYTATLGAAVTGTPLVIHLSNGTDITIPVGSTSATSAAVPVRSDDAYVQGNQSVVVGILGTSGGNYEVLNTSSTVTTVVSDDTDATSVTLSAAANVTEGGSIIYTATLGSAVTGTPLVIHLSNGADITIPVGSISGVSAAVPVRADDAYAQGNQSVVVGINGTSGGNYEALNTTSTVTTVVGDNTDATSVTLSAAANVSEGGSIVYTATVGSAVTGAPLVIHLDNGTDITIPVGSTSATSAAVLVRVDDAYSQGNQSLTVGISSTTGGSYEALNTSSTVTTVVNDDADATTVTLSAASNVSEGGSIVYTATLGSAVTGSPLVIHLSNGEDITIPVGSISGTSAAVPVRADDAYAQGNQSVVVGINGTSGGNYEALNTTSTVTTVVSDDADATSVTLSAAASVTEGGSIVYTATLGSTVTGTPLVIHLSNGEDITIPVGSISGASAAVPVRGDDAYTQGNQSVVVGISGTSGGNYEALNTTSTVTTVVSDDGDVTSVTLSAVANVTEGGSIVYTATVGSAVTDTPLVIHLDNGTDITIPVGSTSADSAAVPVRLDDAYIQGNQTLTVGISGTTGGTYEALNTSSTVSTVVNDDADSTSVTLTASNTVAEGGSIIYTATLANAAHGPVTVNLSNGSVITIADGAVSGTVSVAAPTDDFYIDASTVSATITSASGGNFELLTPNPAAATTTVTDTIGVTTLSLSGAASIREGSSGVYTLSLDHPTLTALTVNLNYTGVAANGADINMVTTATIPAGSSSVNFNINALTDVLTEGNESFTVSVGTTSGGGFESLVVNGAANSVTTAVIDNRAPVAVNDPAVDSVTSKGLLSEYYSYFEGPDGLNVTSLAQINTFISTHGPDATFVATKFDYGTSTAISTNLGFGTNLQTFLGSDAASLSNDPGTSSDAIIRMFGSVELAAGTYNFKVLADDGYQIKVDGVVVAQVNAIQSPTGTVHSQFTLATSGQHSIEILYWDQGGQAVFKAELSNNNGVTYNLLSSIPTTHTGIHMMNEDSQWSITTSELLANDTDADGDTLSVLSVQSATHGTAVLNGSNVIFTPDANYSGAASYTYTISDGHGATSTATVAIDVLAINDNPVANTDTFITSTGVNAAFKTTALLANDTDADGNTITFGSLSNPLNGTVSISGSDITFTPTSGFNGIASVNYSIADGHNGSATGTVNIEVANVIGSSGNNNSLTGNLTTSNTIAGLAGNDKLTGNIANDLLDGGSGNDTLTGGTGADTFVWHLADKGTTSTPAVDTITDFTNGAGGDKLDLRDLLQNETSGNLTNYLHFASDGTNTTVSISSTGAFTGSNYGTATDQTIILSNVNLTGGDTAIINLLKTNSNLITD